MGDSDHGEFWTVRTDPGNEYALSGKIMLCAIVILFSVVVFMVGLHLYGRWYVIRLRRRQLERRRVMSRSHILMYVDSSLPGAAGRGLEPTVLNSLPLFRHSADKAAAEEEPPPECAVCLSEFEDKEIGRRLPKCNHSFHIDCIDMWFKSHSTCPLCRSPVEHATASPPPPPAERENASDPGSSSGSRDGETASFGSLRKGLNLVGVRIEVPPRRAELESELSTQSSPASRLMSFLSIGRKSSPIGGGGSPSTPSGAGTSGGTAELDLESGVSQVTRESGAVQTSV